MSFTLSLETEQPPAWTLASGLKLIRAVQPEVKKLNYHIALGGGVLNTGISYKDLDLYLLPMVHAGRQPDEKGLVKLLESMWGAGRPIGKEDYPEEAPYIAKLRFNYSGARLEVFVLGSPQVGDAVEKEGEGINDEINSAGPQPRPERDGPADAVEGSDGVWRRPSNGIQAAVEDGPQPGTWGGIQRNPEPAWRSSTFTTVSNPVGNNRDFWRGMLTTSPTNYVSWNPIASAESTLDAGIGSAGVERDRPTDTGDGGAAIIAGRRGGRRD